MGFVKPLLRDNRNGDYVDKGVVQQFAISASALEMLNGRMEELDSLSLAVDASQLKPLKRETPKCMVHNFNIKFKATGSKMAKLVEASKRAMRNL